MTVSPEIADVLEGRARWSVAQGDCLDVLRTLPDACVDAVVTDPPYGLTFMGRRWDRDTPDVTIWREALRVLKPGGHLLAFGAPRTYHRLACAIEDAGFEIRDSLHWMFGCLSEDTEIIVNGEWVQYHKATEGSLALCYDSEHDTYSWQPVEKLVVYDYDDTAFRIESEYTDQIVSRNHRCLVERDGRLVFALAEHLDGEARVPVLEGVRDLLDALPLPQSHAGGTQPLLPDVQGCATASASDEEADERAEDESRRVLGVRHEGLEAGSVVASDCEADVLAPMQRGSAGTGVEGTRTQGEGRVDGRVEGFVPREDVGGEQPGVEGRRDVQAGQGELRRAEVRSLPTGVPVDGSQGRIRHGAPAGGGESDRAVPGEDGGGASRRSRHAEQRAVEPDAVRDEPGAQAVRGTRHTSTTLARVTPFHHVGKVWCVKVPTGAFVARRNGKVFVTGNSGFPKSHDVSKALDKAAGAERKTLGVKVYADGHVQRSNGTDLGRMNDDGWQGGDGSARAYDAPSTDAAKQWSGWGTALKPAHEPIVLARKPLVGTVAANVVEHGTGALNIDACRIGAENIPTRHTEYGGASNGDGWTKNRATGAVSVHDGRWPPNVLLSHAPGCAADCAPGCPAAELDRQSNTGGASRFFPTFDPADEVAFRYVAKASRREREAGCEALASRVVGTWGGDEDDLTPGKRSTIPRANTHPTVKPVALMRWLARLVVAPGGVVLDPFAGSGTTGVACMAEGLRFVGIEREPAYVEIARARIAHAEGQPRLPREAA